MQYILSCIHEKYAHAHCMPCPFARKSHRRSVHRHRRQSRSVNYCRSFTIQETPQAAMGKRHRTDGWFFPWVSCQHPSGKAFCRIPVSRHLSMPSAPGYRPSAGLPVPVCAMMHRQQRDHGKAPESGSAIWPRQGWCCFARAKPALFSSPHPQPPARQHVPCISRLPAAETNDRTCGGRGSNGIVTSAG